MSTRLTVCSIVGNTQSAVLNTQLNRLKVAPNGRERSKEMGTLHCTVHYTLHWILHCTQVSRVTCQELGVTCSMLGVMCCMSPVICHMSLTRQQKQPRTLPLLTPPVYTTGCCCCFWPIPIVNLRPMSFHYFSLRNLSVTTQFYFHSFVNESNKKLF